VRKKRTRRLELSEKAMEEVFGLDEKLLEGRISKVEYDRRFAGIYVRDEARRQVLAQASGTGQVKSKRNAYASAQPLKPLEYTSGAFRGHLDPSKIRKLKGFVTVVPGGAPGTGKH